MVLLQQVLRTAVDAAHSDGRISSERRHDYFKSGSTCLSLTIDSSRVVVVDKYVAVVIAVTEFEVDAGLIRSSNAGASCSCFVRKFKGLDNQAVQTDGRIIDRYTETAFIKNKACLSPINTLSS